MSNRVLIGLAVPLLIPLGSALAQQEPPIDVAALSLTVRDLRPVDSLATRFGTLRAAPGSRLVTATLDGLSASNGWLLTTPALFSARVSLTVHGRIAHRIISARAFAVFAAGESRPNWLVQAADSTGTPILHATVRRGEVRVVVLYEVPASTTSLHVMIPADARGVTAIGIP